MDWCSCAAPQLLLLKIRATRASHVASCLSLLPNKFWSSTNFTFSVFYYFSLKRIYLMLYPLVSPIYHSFATVGDRQSGSVDINLRSLKIVVDQQWLVVSYRNLVCTAPWTVFSLTFFRLRRIFVCINYMDWNWISDNSIHKCCFDFELIAFIVFIATCLQPNDHISLLHKKINFVFVFFCATGWYVHEVAKM